MNRQRQTLHILLALMVAVSIVVLSGHNYSHTQSELTSCELCIHHGNSGATVPAEIDTVFETELPDTFIQNHPPTRPTYTDFYHQPSRAPPGIT